MIIRREQYLRKLNSFKNKQLIKVVSGVRRAGKSTLFDLFINDLKQDGITDEQIMMINLEDPQYREFLDHPYQLYDFINERLTEPKKYYVFLDEIQNVTNFEKAVDGLFIKKNVDLYITGSNSYLLSGNLATLLTGRFVEIEILPLSFPEFVTGLKNEPTKSNLSLEEYYLEYLKSSFPYALFLDHDEDVRLYLTNLLDTILLNDVVPRIESSNVRLLKKVLEFLFDSVGSPISINKIATVLSNRGEGKIYPKMVAKYLSGLINAFIFYEVNRFDLKGKQILLSNAKYYAVDNGLRTVLLGNGQQNIGHVLENVVFLELKRRNEKVFVGKIGDLEIDFVTLNQGKLAYYQVATSVLDETTLNRELAPFAKLKDSYPRFLLTLDVIGVGNNYDGVEQLNVLNWLLE